MSKIVIDLDNTLTVAATGVSYPDLEPNLAVIEKLREYKAQGFEIAIYTARNMRTFNGSIGKINANTLPVILEWLQQHMVPFDEIHVGKPWCGERGFYVDDRAIRPDEFVGLSSDEISRLIGNGADQ